jgi:uncharacterized protein YbjT (DUF2867 family)
MNPKILVTGATGTIGSFVIDQLRTRGADFVALVRNREKAKLLNGRGIQTAIGEFDNIGSLEVAMKGIDKLFLLSVTSPEIPRLQGNVTDVARKAGVGHIVKISARGAAMDSTIGIARYHAQAEAYIRQSGVPFTFLRPQAFMQNLLFDSETIRERGELFAQAGDGKISMIDARDIASAAVEALHHAGHEGKTYMLTGPEAISYYDIAEAFTRATGKKVKYIPVTSVQSRSSMLEAGMPSWLVEDLVAVGLEHAAGLASEISPDLERITGRKGHSINDFVNDFIHLFR